MPKDIPRRTLLNSLTVKELREIIKRNGIDDKSMTKIGLGSIIMINLTKAKIIEEVNKVKK